MGLTPQMRGMLLPLLVGASCTYDFPNPKADTPFPCETDKHCAEGFTCVNALCLDAEQFGGAKLLLEGVAPPGMQEVYTLVGGKRLRTAVDGGAVFSLELPIRQGTDIVTLVAQGDEASSRGWVDYASVLGETSELVARAGDDLVLTAAEHDGLRLSTFSTIKYGAVCAANGATVPADRDQLLNAEQSMASQLTNSELADGAAAMALLIDESVAIVPADYGSLSALTCVPQAVRQLIASRRLPPPSEDPVAAKLKTLLAEPALWTAFHADALPPAYYRIVKSHNGFIGWLDGRTTLASGGTGFYQASTYLLPPQVRKTTWSVADGKLRINLAQPLSDEVYLATDQITSYFADVGTKDAITTALAAEGGLFVGHEISTLDTRLVTSGTAVDWVQTDYQEIYRFKTALAGVGVTVNDVTVTNSVPELWTRGDRLSFAPWPSEALEGSVWALQLALPSDRDSLSGEFTAGAPIMTTALVAFGPNGGATAQGGVLAAPLSLSWAFAADGRLRLSYPNGDVQSFAVADAQPSEFGLLSWFVPAAGDEYVLYARGVPADPAFTLTASLLVNQSGRYWRSTINRATVYPDANGNWPTFDSFGFEFAPDRMTRWEYLDTNDDGADEWTGSPLRYSLTSGRAALERWRDKTATMYSECTPATDPSCYVYDRRPWEPVALFGGYLYVIESSLRLPIVTKKWSEANQRWEDASGNPIDFNARVYMFPPRLNAYYITDLPEAAQ